MQAKKKPFSPALVHSNGDTWIYGMEGCEKLEKLPPPTPVFIRL